MYRCSCLGLLLLAAFSAAHDITVDDYFTLSSVLELAVSPDGQTVTYAEARWDRMANNRKSDLWLVPTSGKGKPRRITGDRASDRHLRWSADGKSLLTLANRKRAGEKAPWDGSTQVWQIPLEGDPKPLTAVPDGVSHYDLAPEANALVYVTDSRATDEDAFAKLRATHAKLDYGHGSRKVSTVHRLDLETWRESRLFADNKFIRELAITADGKRIAVLHAPDDTVITSEGRSRVEVWDEATGKVTPTDENWRKSAASPYPWLEGLAWSHDGQRLAYCTVFDAYPAEVIVNDRDSGKWTASRLVRPEGWHIRGYGSPLRFNVDGLLRVLMEREGKVLERPYNPGTKTTGKVVLETEGKVVLATHRGGKQLVTCEGDSESLPEIYAWSPDGTRKQLTHLHPQTAKWKMPSVRHISWKAGDGSRVGGVLELPPGYVKGTKLPLIVGIHGGPTTSVKANREFNPYDGRTFLAARGYAVLCPNYRGSTGYGDRFITELIGRENDVEVKDIIAGIEHLVAEGVADPDRIGVMGWSNGGYLTNCLISLKDPPVKIRAASSGAGILDCVAEWGFNDEPAYPMVFKKGLPWETPEVYKRTSPTYGLGNVTTPTLIHVGANDERCPPGHSRMLYRALKEYRKVPTELIVYPGEPHGLARYESRRAKMEWDLAWFAHYLKERK